MTLGESAVVPVLGGTGSGMGTGAGLGAVGGGVAGLLLGGLLGAGLANRGGLGGWGNNWGSGPATNAVATDIVINPAFQSLQQQIQTLQQQVGANDIRNELESVENTFATISSGQTAQNAANFADVRTQLGNLQTAAAAANFTTLQSINDLGRDVTAQSNQNALQQLNSFNSLQFQNAQATNQIIAQGTANAMAMQQCCCEIKGTILADGNTTRQLINDLNVQNLRDQLSAANNKVSNNEQNQYLLSTILTHLHPEVGRVV